MREALNTVEPQAAHLTDEHLHAAVTEYRQSIEHKRDAERYLKDSLHDTLADCFEKAYELLSPLLNILRARAARELADEREKWPEEAKDPQKATLALLKEIEPTLNDVDPDMANDAFEVAWPHFVAARDAAPDKDVDADVRLEQLLAEVLEQLQPEIVALKADEMDTLAVAMAKRFRGGKTLDDLLPEAFAVVREAGWRTIKMRHYNVQLIGGIVLHQGKIAEMRTGEGKTLVATLPTYLNALTGKGVHVVTVNDYLAQRDAEWMGNIYKFLGLTVGIIVNAVEPQTAERRAAYNADITYGTNNEFGFDYLRDNMVGSIDQVVQRELHYAIVDEVDNILIDEARTPLIISGQGQESTDMYAKFARWAPRLKVEDDFTVEEKTRTVILTEKGIEKLEQLAGVSNIYAEENLDLTRYMENALKAEIIFKRDKDYIVRDGEVIIVDEFTGRQMPGRRYSEGLHQAIEAKEGVTVQRENHTLATITFQNYFRLYQKLAGMTGTAMTEAEELSKIYKLEVISIPTNKPMIRQDLPDLIYRTEQAKFKAVVEEIQALHEQGTPVLVGTTSVEISEYLSDLLEKQGVTHNVLNAKHHLREAQIVAQAGRSKAVTIATNMAGRGTDIVLGGNPAGYLDSILRKHAQQVSYIHDMPENTPDEREEKEEVIQEYIDNMTDAEKDELLQTKIRECDEDHNLVVEVGGLHIIGTERHESRRIDNQLRGRAGRQGDPGQSRFFLSLEDELMRRFAAERVAKVMQMVGLEEDMPLESGMVSKMIEQAQTKVEGQNFDMRKHVVDYDDVIAKQREVIYTDRRAVLERADMHERILGMIANEVSQLTDTCIPSNMVTEEEQLEKLLNALGNWVEIPEDVIPENIHAITRQNIKQALTDYIVDYYEQHDQRLEQEAKALGLKNSKPLRDIERSYTLQTIDRLWMDQIDALDVMRAGIGFRSYGQRDPLVEYKNEAYLMFEELKQNIQHYIVDQLLRLLRSNVTVQLNQPAPQRKAPRKIRTNADDIAKASGQAKSEGANERTAGFNSRGNGSRSNGRSATATAPSRPANPAKIGRNDLCPCGSGKKYKKCHGA